MNNGAKRAKAVATVDGVERPASFPSLEAALARADQNLSSSLARLFELLRIRSISTDPAFCGECRTAAEWLTAYLAESGFDASLRETAGHPIVVGHQRAGAATAPHVLFYGHYDVQPVDPVHEWTSDPFEPVLRDNLNGRQIHGRGASDDKGQLMTFLEACRAYQETHGELPCRVTVLLEGEEEIGSPSIASFLQNAADELKADCALICDTGMWDRQTPAIAGSLRGLVCEEVILTGASRDLHSGYFGGAAANPLHVLTVALAAMRDADGRIALEGFYDGVEETPAEIRAGWDELGRTPESFLGPVGLSLPAGERGRSLAEMTWARPTAEINGLAGGYAGDGFKTIIPASATAKVSFRLVGTQDPESIRSAFRSHVRAFTPDDCRVAFRDYGGAPATRLARNWPMLEQTRRALAAEWPKPAVVTGMGGSIPIVSKLDTILGMQCLLIGFGLPDDRIHAPNEKYELASFHKGIRSWVRVLQEISQ